MDINRDDLLEAMLNRDIGYIESLLALGLDPNYQFDGLLVEGWTLLRVATDIGEKNIIKLLLKNGADINKGDWTALHHAVDMAIDGTLQAGGPPGDEPTDMILFLLNNGANINIKDNKGETPIDIAKSYQSNKIVNLLEEYC